MAWQRNDGAKLIQQHQKRLKNMIQPVYGPKQKPRETPINNITCMSAVYVSYSEQLSLAERINAVHRCYTDKDNHVTGETVFVFI